MTPAQAFDRIADIYDSVWTRSDVGSAQREQVWRVADRCFLPGQRIVDIGCGTGEDAAHLGQRGVHVQCIDASERMVNIARSRGFAALQCNAERVASVGGTWDGVLSNFGALNCVRDLRQVAVGIARLVRPGGYVVLCLLNRRCTWELCRARRDGVRSPGVYVQYPFAGHIARSFSLGFHLIQTRAVGLFVPPSYIRPSHWALRCASLADRALTGLPVARALGDHRLYVFRRRDDGNR